MWPLPSVFLYRPHNRVARSIVPSADDQKSVELERVGFAYPDGTQVLRDISLSLQLGEIVAIVGPTGAGKTTLAHLLPGYIKPTRQDAL